MGPVLCILKVCQDNVQPGEVRVRLLSQGLVRHRQWTHQALHDCHQGFKICHDILWRLIQACIHGQQIPDAAVLSGSSAQQADPRFHTPLFHVGKVHLVSKLQPDAASSPGEKLVAMWLSKLTLAICAAVFKICSRTLPQFRLCNVHDNSFDTFQEGCNSAKLTSFRNVGLSGFW